MSSSTTAQQPPFTIQPGVSASWYDPDHSGEGFIIEALANDRAVLFWFTYDDAGAQEWYLATGEVRGNRLLFPEVRRYRGGVFGPDFDPALVSSETVGSARFTWVDCNQGYMDWHFGNRRARQELSRLSTIFGLGCDPQPGGPIIGVVPPTESARLSGAWYDPSHSGEGYVL